MTMTHPQPTDSDTHVTKGGSLAGQTTRATTSGLFWGLVRLVEQGPEMYV